MLTPHEKWFFDHHGFIILRKVVPPEDIERMIELGNRWHDMTVDELPPPLTSTSRTGETSPTIARTGSIISNMGIRHSNGLSSTERLCA